MSEYIFKKNILYRCSAYLLLLPFIPGFRPLINNYETRDLIVFISGFLITVTLIILSNYKPYITIIDKTLFIYLLQSHKPEIHNFSSIKNIKIKSNRKIVLYFEGYDPLEIRLNKKEQKRLLSIFESENLEINKVYRN